VGNSIIPQQRQCVILTFGVIFLPFMCNELETTNLLDNFGVISLNSKICGRSIVNSFESVGSCGFSNKKFQVLNMLSCVSVWGLWKLRKNICFQGRRWKNI
jgi:hypothetical protein